MAEFYDLAEEHAVQYDPVFTDEHWVNEPLAPATQAFLDTYTGIALSRPISINPSAGGYKTLDWLKNRFVTLDLVGRLEGEMLFDASRINPGMVVRSVVEGLHVKAGPSLGGTTTDAYAHTDTGFLVRRIGQGRTATYYQGNAWHLVMQAGNGRNVAYPLVVTGGERPLAHYDNLDITGGSSGYSKPTLEDYAQRPYYNWLISRTTENVPDTHKPNGTWKQRFAATALYKISSGVNRKGRHQKRQRVPKPSEQFSFLPAGA